MNLTNHSTYRSRLRLCEPRRWSVDVLADIREAEDTDTEEDAEENVVDGEVLREDPRGGGGDFLRVRCFRLWHELGEATVNDDDDSDDGEEDDTCNRCLGDA